MNRRYKMAIFDMDGTFTDSKNFQTEVFYRFINAYIASSTKEVIADKMGATVREIFLDFGMPEERYPALFDQLDHFCRTQIDELVKEIRIVPGIKESLDAMRRRGIKTAVITNSMQAVVERILQLHDLWDRFDYVSGADLESVNKNKRCEAVRMAADVKSGDVLLIGDAESDIILANEMGYQSCFVDSPISWCADREYMMNVLQPDYTVASLEEIKDIWR